MMRLPLQIRFTDIDIFGHVSNSIYAEWFDTARFPFIKGVLPELEPEGRSLVMVHIATNFRKQIVMGDKVYLETALVRVGERSIQIAQRVVNELSGEVHADSIGILSTYDAATRSSFPMPEDWRLRLTAVMEAL